MNSGLKATQCSAEFNWPVNNHLNIYSSLTRSLLNCYSVTFVLLHYTFCLDNISPMHSIMHQRLTEPNADVNYLYNTFGCLNQKSGNLHSTSHSQSGVRIFKIGDVIETALCSLTTTLARQIFLSFFFVFPNACHRVTIVASNRYHMIRSMQLRANQGNTHNANKSCRNY